MFVFKNGDKVLIHLSAETALRYETMFVFKNGDKVLIHLSAETALSNEKAGGNTISNGFNPPFGGDGFKL